MLKLHQTPRMWGLPNFSQSCLKLETWLRMTGIAYKTAAADFSASPKGKVPYIEDNGVRYGDSTLILEHLKRAYGKDPDAELSRVERATALAFRRMIKENLFWVSIYSRYFEEHGWSVYKKVVVDLFWADQPVEEQELRAASFREYMRGQLDGHGMGRHTRDEIYGLGIADITAIADFLGDKPFFMGATPSTVDCTVYGYIANFIAPPIESPAKAYAQEQANLVRYCRRMQERYFPDVPRA